MPKFKRLREGLGVCKISASSWNKMVNIFESIQGVGCMIIKTESGNGWQIVVDGINSDQPYPTEELGVVPPDAGGEGLPDGTIVKWDVVEASPASEGGKSTRKLVQFQAMWDSENGVFVKDEESAPTFVYQLPPPPMSPQWGRVFYDEETHQLYQYEYTWDAETSTWKQADEKTIIVTLESHSSQHP